MKGLLLVACSLLIAMGMIGLAQAPVGELAGTVFDETGAVVPNAPITITNKETGLVRNVTSGSDGRFSVAALPAGLYEVKADPTGFRTLVRDATVSVGGLTTVDLHLQIGPTKDVVTVESVS